MTKRNWSKFGRAGGILLVVGVSLLVATSLRNRVLTSRVYDFPIGLFGPYLLEPRETVVVLRDVTPSENVTLMLVNVLDWNPPEGFSEANAALREAVSVFMITGLRKFDTVLFNVGVRGYYFVLVTTESGDFTGVTEVVVEQRGVAADFWWASWIFLVAGVVLSAASKAWMWRKG